MNSSSQRGKFQRDSLLRRVEEGNTTPEHAQEMLDFYTTMDQIKAEQQAQESWRENNLEYDLRSTEWICDKVKAREEYAQNLYAAMCNNDFQKLATWPLLKGDTYSCSWRYAGGIVADMREQGDYMDWYCTGIRGGAATDDAELTDEQRAKIEWYDKHIVGEGHVTDEIREDLLKLGWKVLEEQHDQT